MNTRDMTSGQVARSIRTFRDSSGDLLRADLSTFADRLQALMHFCRTDIVFSKIHDQLINNPRVDGDKWFREYANAESARLNGLKFPVDPEQRVSLMYQLLAAGEDNPENLIGQLPFWYQLSTNSVSAYINAFAAGVLTPLFRELNYRLEEIEERLPSDKHAFVKTASLQIFHVESANFNIDRRQTITVRDSDHFEIGQEEYRTTINVAFGDLVQRIDASSASSKEKEKAKSLVAKIVENPVVRSIVGTLTEAGVRALINPSKQQ
jgi:hypothetical protein